MSAPEQQAACRNCEGVDPASCVYCRHGAPVQPPADHRQRIATALRAAAYDCTTVGDCALPARECLTKHPVQIDAWYDDGARVGAVHGDVDAIAEVAVDAVQPELAALRAQLAAAEDELLRTRVRLLARDSENDRLTAERTDLTRLLDHSERRRESTVVEARRQAARVDALEQQAVNSAWNTMRLGEQITRLRQRLAATTAPST